MSIAETFGKFFAGASFTDKRAQVDPLANPAAGGPARVLPPDPQGAATPAPYTGPVFLRTNPDDEVTRFNKFREQYNPLRGLDMTVAVAHLEAGERGEQAQLQWLYRTIEKRDAVLRGGKRNLLAAVSGRDWDIHPISNIPPGFTQVQVDSQVTALRAAYERIDNLKEAIAWLALAEFRGFAHLEKHFADAGANDGAVIHLEPVPQWYMGRDTQLSPWRYDPRANYGRNQGAVIEPKNFLIREVEDPIDEIALIAFVRKNLAKKDWDGFVESYGIPSIFIELPTSTSPSDRDDYQAVAEQVISDSRGTIPNGAKVHSLDGAGSRGGVNPFQQHLDYQDGEIAMAITSGALTMLHSSGTGTLAGGAHSDTFNRVAGALCAMIEETFQAQFDHPLIAESFPGQPPLAFFRISTGEEESSVDFIAGVKELKQSGYTVDPEQIEEKTNYRLSAEAAVAPVDSKGPRLAAAEVVPLDLAGAQSAFEVPQTPPAAPGTPAALVAPALPIAPAAAPAIPAGPSGSDAGAGVTPPANLTPEQWASALNARAEVLAPVLAQLNHLIDLANDPAVSDPELQAAVDKAAAEIPGTPVNADALAASLENFMSAAASAAFSQTSKNHA